MLYAREYPSPLGTLTLVQRGEALSALHFPDDMLPEALDDTQTALLDLAARQLDEYFDGRRQDFDLPLAPAGTAFQQQVWQALCLIPYGQTRTYGQIAAQLGRPQAARAVGQANHNNPLPIFIPCDRVVGADGSLTGYGGGLGIKTALLQLERR
ncbi:MAG: methylated-DNA--[protein]-cysteine S-methyltransferase [Eubacteriales bacterium]|nr:methylated-DNA--[protein]-cysteine S-methyltransferase [Eubacteriales bacterium]